MTLLIILLCACVAVIIYCVVAQVLHMPSFAAARNINTIGKAAAKRNLFEDFTSGIAYRISKFIPINVIKETKYKKALTSAGIDLTPKEFLAQCLVKSVIIWILPAIILAMASPLLGLAVVGIMVFFFIQRKSEVFKMGSIRREKIEEELPRFTEYVLNSFATTPNLKEIIKGYNKNNAQTPLVDELTKTVADMEISGVERGLRGLEQRINSQLLSELTRGLIAAYNGDDTRNYLERLSYKMKEIWEQGLTTKALKVESKFTIMTVVIFGVALVTLFIVLVMALTSAGGNMMSI